MASKPELESKLVEFGFTPESLEGKTKPELEALMSEKLADIAKLEEESASAAKALEAIPTPTHPEEKKFTMQEVKEMFKEFKKELAKDADNLDDDDEGPRQHTVRMSRINGKFVIGLKNLNKDPFFPDRVLYSQDIFDQNQRLNVPHVTLILEGKKEVIQEDGSKEMVEDTLTIPLETAFKIANKVVCPLLERKKVDASEKYGSIEIKEIGPDQYNMKGTGNMILGKSKIWKETFVVQLPTMDKPIEVIPDVVNW